MLPHEQEILSQLKNRDTWMEMGGGKRIGTLLREVFKSKDAKLVLKALSSWHEKEGKKLTKVGLIRVARSLSSSPEGEVRKAVEVLGEPFSKELGHEVIWGIVSRIVITNAHERLYQHATNGGASPAHLKETVASWESLTGISDTGSRRTPRTVVETESKLPDSQCQRMPIGIHAGLDRAIGGGLRRKELGLFVAPTNHGKTTTMLRIAVSLAKRRHRVLYLSFEIYRDQIIDRVRQLCGKRTLPKTFYAEDYPSDELTADDVTGIADQIDNLDCLIVDHLDLLAHDQFDLVNAHGLAIRKLRKYARSRGLVVWVPCQADDPSVGQTWLLPEQTYGSRQKRHAADLCIGSLYLPIRNLQTFKIWKSRHSKMGDTFSSKADMVKMKFVDA